MSKKQKWLTHSVSDKVTYWAVRWQLTKWNVLKNHESVSLRVSQWQRFFFRNAWASTNVVIIILSWGCGSIETGNVFHFAFVGHPSGNLLYNGVSLLWNIWTIFSRLQHFFPISPHNTRYQLNLINEFLVTLENWSSSSQMSMTVKGS